jgi:hypothetical protein
MSTAPINQDTSFEVWFCSLSIKEQVLYRLIGETDVKSWITNIFLKFFRKNTIGILK